MPVEVLDKSMRGERIPFITFWTKRNSQQAVWFDTITVNALAAVLAYAGYILRLSPNYLSFASASWAVVAFLASLVLPTDHHDSAIIALYLCVQLSYAFDCADGHLARVSHATSHYGEFLDKCVDAAGGMLCFGAVFGYLFRHYSDAGQSALANLILLFGFLFIVARSSRHFALNKFRHMFKRTGGPADRARPVPQQLLLSLMDAQASAMGILLFLLSPWIGLGFYACQTLILSATFLRYFRRAYLMDQPGRRDEGHAPSGMLDTLRKTD